MNIVLVSAEVHPFAKVGGLADVCNSLAKEWEKLGHRVVVVMPKYGSIDTQKFNIRPTAAVISVPMGTWTEYARLWYGEIPGSTVPVYFLESSDYYDNRTVYGEPEGYADNDRRFLFLSRAVFEVVKALNFQTDILYANDWHTGFSLAYLKSFYRNHPLFASCAGIYGIHNAAHQGWADAKKIMPLSGFGNAQFYAGSWFEFQGGLNMMKTGLMFADKIITVSPRYAVELRQTSQGYGLQPIFNARAGDLIGILNGIDYDEWNPATDSKIYKNFTYQTLEGKKLNKQAYLRECGIADNQVYADMPLIGMVARMNDQKGFDLVEEVIERFLWNYPARFTLLGTGDKRYERFFKDLARKYPTRALIHIAFNNDLAHKIEAASDIFLMPSKFEPCGLNQMYSLRYGTVPVVRATGGLADTVAEYNPATGLGNGFVFSQYNAGEMGWALDRAVNAYYNKPLWQRIIFNGMTADNSSTRSALQYIQVFGWAQEKYNS